MKASYYIPKYSAKFVTLNKCLGGNTKVTLTNAPTVPILSPSLPLTTYSHLERDADQNNLPLPLPSTQEFLHSEPIKSPSLVYL